MEWKTTSTVLAKLHDYDQNSAWTLLAGHFQEPVVRFGRRMGLDTSDAQDAAQETLLAFADAYRKGRYDPDKGRLKSWLFGIAHRQIMNLRRKAAAHRAREKQVQGHSQGDPLEAVPDSAVDMEAAWEEEWRRSVYERSLAMVRTEVEPQTFDLFRRFVFDGLGADEVAVEFSVSRTKVYNAKYRVTKRLAELARTFDDA